MKKVFLFLLCAWSLNSCDDGDLIVTNFNFEDKQLNLCGNETKVLFNLNNDDANEAIALVIVPADESLFMDPVEGTIEIPLNNQNQVSYRTFTGEVSAEYYCKEIPPISPEVVEEYQSTTGGTVIIATQLQNDEDHDGDGVPSEDEEMATEQDTDADGIPDYLDIDDDGDNVETEEELNVEDEEDSADFSDTDQDGIPNYLDKDDDGDDIITRMEDWNQDVNPTNDLNEEGVPRYLDPESVTDFIVEESLENTFSQSYRYTISIKNLTLMNQGGNGEQIRIENYYLGYLDAPSVQVTLPEPDEGEGEGDGNGGGEGDGNNEGEGEPQP